MSIASTAQRVSLLDVVRAEALRSRRTFTWGSVAAPLIMSVWAINLASALEAADLSTADGRWAGNILAWMSFYPNAVALPVGALVGAMHEWRERRVRGGGTLWRPTDPRRILTARCLIISASSLLAQIGWLAPVLLYALSTGSGWGNPGDYLAFAALMWVSVTGAGMLGLAAARVLGPLAVGLVPAAAFAWSMAGALQAERQDWLIRPWTWMIRPTLPLLGVHGNSVNLEPGAAAWTYPVWPGMVLQAGCALAALALTLATSARLAPGPARRAPLTQTGRNNAPPEALADAVSAPVREGREPTTVKPTGRPQAPAIRPAGGPRSTLRALSAVLPWRLWALLELPLVGLIGLVRVVYGSQYAVSLLALAGVPVACTVVGITTWASLREAWRSVLMRTTVVRAVLAALTGGWAFLAPALGAAWAVAVVGPDPASRADGGICAVYVLMVLPWVALALSALAYAVTQVRGTATAIVVAIIGVLAGLVIAGNQLIASAPGIWLTAPWGWAQIAGHFPQRWVQVVGMCWLLAAASAAAAAAAGRRAARAARE